MPIQHMSVFFAIFESGKGRNPFYLDRTPYTRITSVLDSQISSRHVLLKFLDGGS